MNGKQAAKEAAAIAAGLSVLPGVYRSLPSLKKSEKSLRGSRPSAKGYRSSEAPASRGNQLTSFKAQTTPTSNGVRIKYRELINPAVAGQTAYAPPSLVGANVYNINPGLSNFSPWLSVQAVQYEQYRYHSLRFIYIPFVNTSINGDVMMMVDYNAQDPIPATEPQFLDHPGAMIGSVWEALEFRCNIPNLTAIGPRRFVRPCAVAGDIKTYDCGRFYITTNNVSPGSATVGKLFIEYDVEFFTPQLVPSPSTFPTSTSLFEINASQVVTTNVTSGVNFPAAIYDPLNINLTPGAPIFTPPAGCYRLATSITAQSTTSLTSFIIYLLKNGSSIGAGVKSAFVGTCTNATGSFDYILPCNGTDTFQVGILCVGTGTLSVIDGQLVVSLA